MLSSHPSPDALDRYRRGLLAPEELLAVDDHLAACPGCREAALRPAPVAGAEALHTLLGGQGNGHPEFEELAAYVDGTQDDVAREVTDMHLADCASCREEVADLRALRARQPAGPLTLALSPQAGRGDSDSRREDSAPVRVRGLGLRLALALPAAAVIIWMLIPRSAVTPVAPAPIDRPTARIEPGVKPGEPPSVPAAAAVATLRDAGGVVTLDAAGQLTGLPSSVPQQEQTMLVAALSTGRMPLPELIRDLAAEGEMLRGSSGAGGASMPFTLHEPIGTAVESDRPHFRWERSPAARAYIVSVYDEDFALVARSPELTSAEWICDRPLARGKNYTWQVSALTAPAGGVAAAASTLTVPAAPAPPARFVVLTQRQAGELARLRQAHADAHLVMALAYARAGVRDAAERELRVLQRDNPDAVIVRTLLASLR
jgi:anti-sigma factor RsiW